MIRTITKLKQLICLVGVVSIVCLFFLTGCNPYNDNSEKHRLIYADDFVFQIREEESRAVLIDITAAGGQKEVLKVPAFIDGFTVDKIGLQTSFWGGTRLKGDKVKKIYLPYTTRFILRDLFVGMENISEIVAVFNYIQETSGLKYPEHYSEDNPIDLIGGSFETYIYTQSHFNKLTISPTYSNGVATFFLPNYIFNFNYFDSPNEGIYWIDRVTENNLKLLPDNPTREGYDFGGWYLEEECQIEWNMEFDTQEKLTNQFYAKWIKL